MSNVTADLALVRSLAAHGTPPLEIVAGMPENGRSGEHISAIMVAASIGSELIGEVVAKLGLPVEPNGFGGADVPQRGAGFVRLADDDGDVVLYVMTPVSVIESEARFSGLSADVLVAAIRAIRSY